MTWSIILLKNSSLFKIAELEIFFIQKIIIDSIILNKLEFFSRIVDKWRRLPEDYIISPILGVKKFHISTSTSAIILKIQIKKYFLFFFIFSHFLGNQTIQQIQKNFISSTARWILSPSKPWTRSSLWRKSSARDPALAHTGPSLAQLACRSRSRPLYREWPSTGGPKLEHRGNCRQADPPSKATERRRPRRLPGGALACQASRLLSWWLSCSEVWRIHLLVVVLVVVLVARVRRATWI